MPNLDLVPATELLDALLRREGLAVVVGVYDMKAVADATPTTPIYGILSAGDLPLRIALGVMIQSHLAQLVYEKAKPTSCQ